MLTLRPKPFSVNIVRNFCVNLLNFDLNNSTLSGVIYRGKTVHQTYVEKIKIKLIIFQPHYGLTLQDYSREEEEELNMALAISRSGKKSHTVYQGWATIFVRGPHCSPL